MRYSSKSGTLLILIVVSVVYLTVFNSFYGDESSEAFEGNDTGVDVFCIFTRADERRGQKEKLGVMLSSMLARSTVPVSLHVIVDEESRLYARDVIEGVNSTRKPVQVKLYNIVNVVSSMEDIVSAMKPHFSPKAGSYYSDSLFYVSLGLHRIAPPEMSRAVLIDVDVRFHDDVAGLFTQFDQFSESNLFGLAPELDPVYFHLLSTFRSHLFDRRSDVGLPCCARLPISTQTNLRYRNHSSDSLALDKAEYLANDSNVRMGRPGLNSGVVLLRLDRIRTSVLYQTVISPDFVTSLVEKYYFKGHLGDQDFYSILSWELPLMIYFLDCGWNRQLCTWWKDHGYHHIHQAFSYCPNTTKLYHANCNSRFPD